MNLRVTIPFADYQVGDLISDPGAIDAILVGDAQHYVVRVSGDPGPVTATGPTPSPVPIPEP